jgi:PAS domain S-box-containing protein
MAHLDPAHSQIDAVVLREFTERICDALYLKDNRGRFVWCNKSFAQNAGAQPRDIIGKTDFDLFPKRRARLMNDDDAWVMNTGRPIIDKVERLDGFKGKDSFISTTKIPRHDAHGKVIGVMGIARDVTNREHLNTLRQERAQFIKKIAALNEISKSHSDFINTISHELRVPIAVARESLSLVLNNTKDCLKDSHRRIIARAHAQLDHVGNITEAMLDLSRMEKGTFRLRYSLINLNDLLKELAQSYRSLARDKKIRLFCALPSQPLNIFVDPDRIDQVVSNLLDNAVKFTESGGSIRLQVEILENKVRVGIYDNGIGISQQDLSRIFTKGFQGRDGKVLRRNKGLGLGLAIAKELVDRHGGEIWVESVKGSGSTFFFTLPRFYSSNVLDQSTREQINGLLEQDVAVHLINLLIVNYRDFKKLLYREGAEVVERLKGIIQGLVSEFQRRQKKDCKIFLSDFVQGECTIIFPEASESEVARLCSVLKERINRFLAEHKVENSFINIGVLEFMYKNSKFASGLSPVSIYVKKIFIGAEKRKDKRHAYQVPVEPITVDGSLGAAYTLDISRSGMCFVSSRQLKTDGRIGIRLFIPKTKKVLMLLGRVVWIKAIAETPVQSAKYQTGIQFVNLQKGQSQALSRYIRSIAHKKGRVTA